MRMFMLYRNVGEASLPPMLCDATDLELRFDRPEATKVFLANAKAGDVLVGTISGEPASAVAMGRRFVAERLPFAADLVHYVMDQVECRPFVAREALVESEGDIDKAVWWLRQQGLA